MGLPKLEIIFRSVGAAFITRSEKGTLAVILEDTAAPGAHVITSVTEIPAALGVENKKYLERAFLGYQDILRRIELFVIPEGETLTDALAHLETVDFDYLVGMPDLAAEDAATLTAWIKTQRQEKHGKKAVLPNQKADNEGIINFTASGMVSYTTTDQNVLIETAYTTEAYCSRIAGLILGTPMTMSCTYAPLPDIDNVDRKTNAELDEAVDKGEFVLFHDGDGVLVGRGVNSFTTTTAEKGSAFQKIKIVEAIDMIQKDLLNAWRKNYVGKYANSYDNKVLLIVAIQGYLEELERLGIIAEGSSEVGINIEKQRTYLKQQGVDVDSMTETEIRQADTDSHVFLKARAVILDAIEDISLDFEVA